MFVVDPPWVPKEWSKLSECLICVWSLVVLLSVFMSSICFWWDMYCHQLPTSLERESQKAALWSRLQLFRLSRHLFYQNFLLLIILFFLPRFHVEKRNHVREKDLEKRLDWARGHFLVEIATFYSNRSCFQEIQLYHRSLRQKINTQNTSSFKAF